VAFRPDDGAAVLQSRSRRLLTRFFPEIAAGAAFLPPSVVLDGELVVWRHDRVDFAALQRRIHPSAKRARELAAQTPASYVAFDVLQHDARDVRRLPYRERRSRLTRLWQRSAAMGSVPGDGAGRGGRRLVRRLPVRRGGGPVVARVRN